MPETVSPKFSLKSALPAPNLSGPVSPAAYLRAFLLSRENPAIDMKQAHAGLKSWIDGQGNSAQLQGKLEAMGSPFKFAVAYVKKKQQKKKQPEQLMAVHAPELPALALEADSEMTLQEEQELLETLALHHEEISEMLFDGEEIDFAGIEDFDPIELDLAEIEITPEDEMLEGQDLLLEESAISEIADEALIVGEPSLSPEAWAETAPEELPQETVLFQQAVAPQVQTQSAESLSKTYLNDAREESNAKEAVTMALTAAHLDQDNALSAAHALLNKMENGTSEQKKKYLSGVGGTGGKNRAELNAHINEVQGQETDHHVYGGLAYLKGDTDAPKVKVAKTPAIAIATAFEQNLPAVTAKAVTMTPAPVQQAVQPVMTPGITMVPLGAYYAGLQQEAQAAQPVQQVQAPVKKLISPFDLSQGPRFIPSFTEKKETA